LPLCDRATHNLLFYPFIIGLFHCFTISLFELFSWFSLIMNELCSHYFHDFHWWRMNGAQIHWSVILPIESQKYRPLVCHPSSLQSSFIKLMDEGIKNLEDGKFNSELLDEDRLLELLNDTFFHLTLTKLIFRSPSLRHWIMVPISFHFPFPFLVWFSLFLLFTIR
jgi:hypothetical protein